MSQAQLADAAGMTRSALMRVGSGVAILDVAQLFKFADALGVAASLLVARVDVADETDLVPDISPESTTTPPVN